MSNVEDLLTRRMVQIATDAGATAWPTVVPDIGVVIGIDYGVDADGVQSFEFETVHTFGDLRRVLAKRMNQ